MLWLWAQTTTTTTEEVPRIVGDPLPTWEFWLAGALVLAFILIGGWWFTQRSRKADAAERTP
jgi:hypothetical protein